MSNLLGSINLMKLANASYGVDANGKKCIMIPIDENDLFVSDKGTFLSITAWDNGRLDAFGKSHRIKQSFSKEYREKYDSKNKPILGNFKILEVSNSPETNQTPTVNNAPTPKHSSVDDMPF